MKCLLLLKPSTAKGVLKSKMGMFVFQSLAMCDTSHVQLVPAKVTPSPCVPAASLAFPSRTQNALKMHQLWGSPSVVKLQLQSAVPLTA